MKRAIIVIGILIGVIILSGLITQVYAQRVVVVKKEKRIERKQNRRVARKVNRRINRRVHRRAHLRYAHLPPYNSVVRSTPRGAVIIKHGGVSYSYYSGIYYLPIGNEYRIIRPAVGVRVSVLPADYRKLMVNGTTYFYYYGTFYKKAGGQFETTKALEDALVDALPEGYEIKDIDGIEYYALDGVFFQEIETDELETGIGYLVVDI